MGTLFLAFAIVNTLFTKKIKNLAFYFPKKSLFHSLFYLLGEVELAFGFWGGLYLLFLFLAYDSIHVFNDLKNQSFLEPVFIFIMMTLCSTRPLLVLASKWIHSASKFLPIKKPLAFYITTLTMGPCIGSLLTEPAAMTLTAFVLLRHFFIQNISPSLQYSSLSLLFVNVSLGGTLTSFAAPPVLMVAQKWGWNSQFMLSHFGWKALIAILVSTLWITYRFRHEIIAIPWEKETLKSDNSPPLWLTLGHGCTLFLVLLFSHQISILLCIFGFFLILIHMTQSHQTKLKLKESFSVFLFLSSLIVLGSHQSWWLEPLLLELKNLPLYLGAILLTAITDNAALTYLASQVPFLDNSSRYLLVAGTLVGGGLTLIANAPNLTGYEILRSSFGEKGISPFQLFTAALTPTVIAGCCFWFF